MDNQTNASGGANIEGNVNLEAGDFVGRDKIIIELSSFLDKAFMALRLSELEPRVPKFSQTYFEQFIHPIWLAFNTVHDDYKTAFRAYLHELSQANVNTSELRASISRDLIFSMDLIVKLEQQVRHISSVKISEVNTLLLSDFLNAISEYFFSPYKFFLWEIDEAWTLELNTSSKNNRSYPNLGRAFAIYMLRDNPDYRPSSAYLTEFKKQFESIFHGFQISYSQVAEAYYKLKKAFIDSES